MDNDMPHITEKFGEIGQRIPQGQGHNRSMKSFKKNLRAYMQREEEQASESLRNIELLGSQIREAEAAGLGLRLEHATRSSCVANLCPSRLVL